MSKRITFIALLLSIFSVHSAAQQVSQAEIWFATHKDRPPMIRQFLQQMPKGADLHTHLSGAVYAETYIELAKKFDHCVNIQTYKLHPKPCENNSVDFPATALTNVLYDQLIRHLSMKDFHLSGKTGHDLFFDSFSLFQSISSLDQAQAVFAAEVLNRAASQNIQLIESSISVQSKAVVELGTRIPIASIQNFSAARDQLLSDGLANLVVSGKSDNDRFEAAYLERLGCSNSNAQPGCSVKMRYILQTNRNGKPGQVFAQLAYAFELAKVDARVVGIGLVAPEDDQVALSDYEIQMEMIKYLSSLSPNVKITLHAGELAFGSVPPKFLRNHIQQAVKIANADRIGHGVDIGFEDNALDTLQFMKQKGVAVEICLTSNDVILNVKGANSPLKDYLKAGVPVVLASDDEGISRIDLTNEYVRAALEQGLSYKQLKQISRNSLTWSFLPGASIWSNPMKSEKVLACRNDHSHSKNLSATCKSYLENSEKADAQWKLELALAQFENSPQWLKK